MERKSGREDDFYVRHPRMPLSERAKIFMPFEPLKGYRALLAERERQMRVVPRMDLSDEQRCEISDCIRALKSGDAVCITYYADDCYQTLRGLVSKVRLADGELVVADEVIAFGDIGLIERMEH